MKESSISPLERWTAFMGLCLLTVTWPLWWNVDQFPAIPLLKGLEHGPAWLVRVWFDRAWLLGLTVGLLCLVVGSGRTRRSAWWAIGLCGLSLVALNQHRLQPWLYQLLIFSCVFGVAQPRFARRLAMGIVISVYLYSAGGKLDFEFLHTVGQQFWHGLWALLPHGDTAPDDHLSSIAWVSLLPLTELLLGVGLLSLRTRPVGGVAACLFHGLLIWLLGPWGLQHSWGVVLWNVQFAGQAWLLFVAPARERKTSMPQSVPQSLAECTASATQDAALTSAHRGPVANFAAEFRATWGNRCAAALCGLVICMPAVERWGCWDHWTSWALYAPHSSRVEVWIASTAIERLPSSLQSLMAPSDTDEVALWQRVPLEAWSLAQTGSPIYPQDRFQLGVAVALARQVNSPFAIKAVWKGVANRWNGQRTSQEVLGTSAFEQWAESTFWFNVQPRTTAISDRDI